MVRCAPESRMDRGCGRSDPRFDRLSPSVRPASGMLTIRGRTGPLPPSGMLATRSWWQPS